MLTLKLADGAALKVDDGHQGTEACRSLKAMAIMTMFGRRQLGDGIAEMGAARPLDGWPGCRSNVDVGALFVSTEIPLPEC